MLEPYQANIPHIAPSVYIHPSACIIGKVMIEADSSIWPMAILRGDVNKITIGSQTNIQDASVLHATHDGPYTPGGIPLIIGNRVTIGHSVILHACYIEDACLIGMGTIVMDKAHIHAHTLVGAGSLVPPGKVLTSGYLWLGNPVKRIRKLKAAEIDAIEYSADHYVKLKNTYTKHPKRSEHEA